MVYEEIKQHREALEEEGWLKGGEIIQLWTSNEDNYPLSYYIVGFPREGNEDRLGGVVIYCFRVFGGIELAGHIFPVNVSADQVAQFYDGQPMHLQNNPNWRAYKDDKPI